MLSLVRRCSLLKAVLAFPLKGEVWVWVPIQTWSRVETSRDVLTGLLEPLPIGASNFRERLDGLLAAMSSDILGRVLDDKLEEDRCPFRLQNKPVVYRSRDQAPFLSACILFRNMQSKLLWLPLCIWANCSRASSMPCICLCVHASHEWEWCLAGGLTSLSFR